MATVRIIGKLIMPNGEPAKFREVQFKRMSPDVAPTPGGGVVIDTVEFFTDIDANLDAKLVPGRYVGEVADDRGRVNYNFAFTITGEETGGVITLQDLLAAASFGDPAPYWFTEIVGAADVVRPLVAEAEGYADDAAGSAAIAEAVVASAQPFANRAAAVAGILLLSSDIQKASWKVNDRIISVMRQTGATQITDMPGWVPSEDKYTAHYSTNAREALLRLNATPNTANISSAISVDLPITVDRVFLDTDPKLTYSQATSNGDVSWEYASFRDDGFVPLHRLPGRVLVGAEERHSGNRHGVNGYGDDPMSQYIASWAVKNAWMAVASPDPRGRTGIMGLSWVQAGNPANSAIGVTGFARHDGTSGGARGVYAEAYITTDAVGTAAGGIEIQVGNRSTRTPSVSPYDMSNSVVSGIYLGAESQQGYTFGDSDEVMPDATLPCGTGLQIAGGSIGSDAQKFTAGILIRQNALVRDSNGFADAMILAQKHRIRWEASAFSNGASIWSEVTSGSSKVAQAFKNNEVDFYGSNDNPIFSVSHDTSGAGSVNWISVKAASAGNIPAINVSGADTNINLRIATKGTGQIRFGSHGGAGESFRIIPSASAATDFATVTGSAGGGLAIIGTAGASSNIDLYFTPKGSGYVRFGSLTPATDSPITGYISIKDASGVIRKLAVIA